MIFYLLIILMILTSKIISKKWNFSLFFGGMLVGFFFEVYYEFCWNYSEALRPFIWRDVSLVVILGWGTITQLALSISEFIAKQYKITNQIMLFLADLLIIYLFLFVNEQVMSAMGFWSYNNDLHPQFFAQFFGFVFLSFILTNVARRINYLTNLTYENKN